MLVSSTIVNSTFHSVPSLANSTFAGSRVPVSSTTVNSTAPRGPNLVNPTIVSSTAAKAPINDSTVATTPTHVDSTIADETLSGPSIVPATIPHSETKLYKLSTERASFYANGLYWVFWENTGTCEGQNGCLYYATSPDGLTWNTAVNVGVHVNREDFSVITNSTHAFYARYNETSFFSTNCNRALLFSVGMLTDTVAWQPEQVVRAGNATASWLNPVLRLDSNNQAWIGYLDYSNTGCGGNGIEVPAVVHSEGTNYGSWTGYTYLSTSLSRNWVVDLASLPGGAMYAIYSIYDNPISYLRGRLFNSTWSPEENVSPVSDLIDNDAFVFSAGYTLFAVWLDTNTRTLSFNSRVFSGPSLGTWNATVRIATSECCTSKSGYPIPWTATYDARTSKIYMFWYNYTLNRIDLYSGLSGTWTGPILGWSTVSADSLTSLTTFQYSVSTGTNNTIGIAFIDSSSTSTPVLKYEVDKITPPPTTSGGAGGGGGGHVSFL